MRVLCTLCDSEVSPEKYRTAKCHCTKTIAYVNGSNQIIGLMGKATVFCANMDDLRNVAHMFCGGSTKVVMGNSELDTALLGLYSPSNERHVECLFCHNRYALAPKLPSKCKCGLLTWHFEKKSDDVYHLSWIAGRFNLLDLKQRLTGNTAVSSESSALVPSAGATKPTVESTGTYTYLRDGAVECNLGDD